MTKTSRLLYCLALLRIIIPYLLQNPVYEPHRDEFLYLAEGHHLAFGFMEVPPMLSVFAWLTHFFNDGMFWIKLWPSLFGAATFIVAGKIIESLGGKSFALILLFFSFLFGAYLRMFFLFQPNAPEIFFWTMIAFSCIRFTQTKKNKWLYVFGLSVGLGMLSKYSVAFYTVSILLGLLCTKYRTVFSNKHFWFASLIGFFIFLPNLIWQWQNHFPVVVHMHELQQTQLQYINPSDFLVAQLLLMFPCVFVWLTGLFNTLSSRQYRFIGLAYVFLIILLLIGQGKDYYSAGVYPPLFAFGATALQKFTAQKRKYLRYAFIVFSVGLGLFVVPILLPVLPPEPLANLYVKMNIGKTGSLKWEDLKNHPLPQDFSDMLGWEEMTQKVAKAYSMLSDSEKNNATIFCNNYGMAGAVNYYASKYHLPEAYSDNASFLYWMPADMGMKNFVLVSEDPDEQHHDFAKGFTAVIKVDSIITEYAREKGDYIYLFKGADTNFEKFFKAKIAKDKAEFKY
ncbi:MAG: glycosyltransferase family 39 protein [Parafilimonas sp.]|nr:glycosyltransferase family 39 protein [Parafilimonas sp.]